MKRTTPFIPPSRTCAGYSLIELAMSIVVVGILLASGATAYNIYKKDQSIATTAKNVASMTEAINSYRSIYGTYPCPARLNVPRTDTTYGQPDCTTTTAAGSCLNGICIQNSPDATKGAVRIGTIPFRVLNIDDTETYDSYGSRLYYAVTESLTVPAAYREDGGGIELINDSGVSAVTPPASIRYLIFSSGPDRAGGFSKEGVATYPCVPSRKDGSNCDFSQINAVFRTSTQISRNNNNHFDDIIQPYIKSEPPFWRRTESNSEDIEDLSPQNIGISEQSPANELVVSGNIVARSDGTPGTGNVHSAKLCSADGSVCFEPRNIAGDVATGVVGDGMKCASPYEYMAGIRNGQPICRTITTACPPPSVAQGTDAAGQLLCSNVSNPCAPKVEQICGVDIPLPAMPSGGFVGTHTGWPGIPTGTPTVGINRAYRFLCADGIWRNIFLNGGQYAAHDADPSMVPWVGDCSCTPETSTTGGVACGAGFSGTYTVTKTTTCVPSMSSTSVTTFDTDCTCIGNSGSLVESCVPPASGPGITKSWTQSCIGNVLQPRVFDPPTGSCGCPIKPDLVRTEACPATFAGGTRTYVRKFNPATCTHDSEKLDSDTCVCAADEKITHLPRTDCPACTAGDRTVTLARGGALCKFTIVKSDVANACKPANFAWKTTSTLLYTAPSSSLVAAGSGCSCGDAPINCKIRLGGTDYIYACSCQPQ